MRYTTSCVWKIFLCIRGPCTPYWKNLPAAKLHARAAIRNSHAPNIIFSDSENLLRTDVITIKLLHRENQQSSAHAQSNSNQHACQRESALCQTFCVKFHMQSFTCRDGSCKPPLNSRNNGASISLSCVAAIYLVIPVSVWTIAASWSHLGNLLGGVSFVNQKLIQIENKTCNVRLCGWADVLSPAIWHRDCDLQRVCHRRCYLNRSCTNDVMICSLLHYLLGCFTSWKC